MRIGIPREIKPMEGRVALNPAACGELVRAGHELTVEEGAGSQSGYPDDEYLAVGVRLAANAAALYEAGELIVKVKEPVDQDLEHLRGDHRLFCYLHLAAQPELTRRLLGIGLTAIGFETVELENGALPLLAPMSDIAGRLSVQIGSCLLHRHQGGKGVLMGGLPAVERGNVVIFGAGTAGGGAAILAAGLGATVTVFDLKRERLEAMRALGNNVTALYPYAREIERQVREADLIIGAVLVTGDQAPRVVTAEMVRSMAAGSVIVDISVDQGGCVETTRPMSYQDPPYKVDEIVHLTVTNMPSAVPRSATQALSASLLPYVRLLAGPDWRGNPDLVRGVNTEDGEVVHPALKHVYGN